MIHTVETYCGRMVFDDQGRLLAEVYAPGFKPLVGKGRRQCETCWHWQKRQDKPGWLADPACPCFECAGYGYSVTGDLVFWKPREEARP